MKSLAGGTLIALVGAVALGGCGSKTDSGSRTVQTSQATTAPAIGGPFQLVDQNGAKVTDKDLLGKPSLVFFGFTFCPEVCPTTLLHMTKWLKELGPDADKLNVVYVTVDPQRDTSKQLKQYLTSFDPRIRGLTGSPGQIATITKNYHVYSKRVPLENGDYTMDHSTMIYMMDPAGQFIAPIGYGEPDANVLPMLRDLLAGRTPKPAAPDPSTAIERSAT